MRITMPQLGESVVEGTIGRWLKAEGDRVERYEPLLEIVTDKVNAEYPSPVEGTLRRIIVPEGETVAVDTEIAEVEAVGEAAAVEPTAQSREALGAEERQTAGTDVGTHPDAGAERARERGEPRTGDGAEERGASHRRYSPAVRRLAEEHGLDLALLAGTGAGGRVSRRDVEAYLERGAGVAERVPPAAVLDPALPDTLTGASVTPPMAPAPAQPATLVAAAELAPDPFPAVPREEGDTLVPLTPMRRAIAEHMVRSLATAPHVTTVMEVDMTPLLRYRQAVRAEFERREGVPLTPLPFVIRAVVASLKEHPALNATWTPEGVLLRRRINIGVAVGLEDGLLVPVIHDADGWSVTGLARAVHDLATRARAGTLRPEDVRGGTFTVNNPGTFGTLISTPVINQPQAAILTTEAITKRPVVTEDEAIAIRSMMYICLSFDHRMMDGIQAARFLRSVKLGLEAITPGTAGL